MIQRRLNSSFTGARDGAPKKLVAAPPVHGQQRQTKGEPAAFHHGVTVDDTPNTTKSFTGEIPLHPGVTDAQRAKVHPVVNDPKVILTDAANLGRPPEKT